MTSEFDKDEINDSSFPIDFNDDSTSLDMFGVWVKRGPRSASQASPAVAPAGLDEPTPMNASPSDRDFVDLSDLPELPDFGEPIPDEGELAQSAIIEPLMDEPAMVESAISEEIVYPEVNELESEPEPELISEPELIPEPELAQDDLMEINLDEFLGAGAEISESAINDETIQTEPSKTVEETIIPEEIVDFGVVEEPVAPEEMEISFDSADERGIPSSLDEIESLKEPIEEADFSLPEKDNLPSDDDFSSFLDDLNSGSIVDSSAEPRPASTSTSVADDLDLDSFINSVNETGSSSHEDSEKVFSDTEPVDIELEFDESYIEDVQKIKAAGAASSDSEFFNQDFGVELIDETGGLSDNSADGIFESVSDIPSMEGGNSKETSDSSSLGIETTNEFDDLLSSLDLSPTPSMAVKSEAKPTAQSKKARFDLVVTDEGDESITSNVTETATDEDLEVSLTGDQTVKHVEQSPAKVEAQSPSSASIEEELADFFVKDELPAESPVVFLPEDHEPKIEDNLDIPEIRDYNETNSGENWVAPEVVPGEEEVSLDFDDISAIEKDLNEANLEPGETQLTANDKSTELLMKIADELSSIKIELSTLKTELANVKPVSGDKLDTNVVDEQNSENSGFFTDDDTDETIALTGDELNNILITADFTEEKNADAEMAAEAESPEADILSSIPMEAPVEEAVIEQSPVEETPLDEELEIPDILPETAIDAVPIESPIPGVEVAHVTTLAEDTSYLEGSEVVETDFDNVAIEEPELEIIDFDDEKLEEPELTEFNLDLTEIEASLPAEQEVSVDVPVMEQFVETAPVQEVASFETIPVEATPAEATPAEATPAEATPAEATPAEAAPAEATPAEALPMDEAIPEIAVSTGVKTLPIELKDEIKSVLSYMDQLLESLPEDKIEEFARSEHFEVYKKLFEELGIS